MNFTLRKPTALTFTTPPPDGQPWLQRLSPGLFGPGLFGPGLFGPGLFGPGLFGPGLFGLALLGLACLGGGLVGCGDNGASGGGGGDASTQTDAATNDDGGADAGAEDAELRDAATDGGEADGGSEFEMPPPGEPGPYEWDTVEATLERDYRDTPVVAYVPQDPVDPEDPLSPPPGPFPLAVFIPGFEISSWRYEPTITHLASHGFVVIRCDPIDLWATMDHLEMTADVQGVLDWALDPTAPVAATVDASHIVVSGHSLGGKIASMVAYRDPRVTETFTIDAVNAVGPYGYISSTPDVLPEEVAPLEIPMGFVGETTNAQPGLGYNACAPEIANFERYYEAVTSAPWAAMWNFSGADHIDFIDDIFGCTACAYCEPGTADGDEVRAGLRTLFTAFMRYHTKQESSLAPTLIGVDLPAGITEAHKP